MIEDQLFSEQFHEVFEIEPRAGSFDRLRSVLIRHDWQARGTRRFRLELPRLGIRLAAVLALVLLAVASAGAFIAIHQYAHRSVLVHPAPFKVKSQGSAVCFSGCQLEQVTFVSTSVGFVLESKAIAPFTCAASCPSPSPLPVSLFRTTDAGAHWSELTTSTINCCQARLIASADGSQLLLFGLSNNSAVLLYSRDAGANWTSHGLPEGAGQAVETGCKGGHCASTTISPLVYFVDPREGWVLTQEQSFNIADLYQTTNAGANWTLVGKINLNQQFGLDLAKGSPLGNGIIDHSLVGQFVFSTSSLAWFVPQPSCVPDLGSTGWGRNRMFRSTDGGLTWTPTNLASPTGLIGSASVVPSVNFFDNHRGVLDLVVNPRSCDPQSGYAILERRFVYTTADGGTSWSTPTSVPQPSHYSEMRYIDPQHWVGWPAGGGWISTSDAGQHWTVVQTAAQFGDRPAAAQGLPPQLPDNYPLNDQFGFVDPAHGWALPYQTSGDPNARGVTLYLTNDAGSTWRPSSLPELA